MASLPESIWIVDADPDAAALLGRFAGAVPSVSGSPGGFPVDTAPAPRVVVLHVGPDLSAALDFAHRTRLLHPRAGWVLVRDESIAEETLDAAFGDLRAERLAWPSDAERLPAALARAAGRGAPAGLRARRQRDALVRRFSRMLGDLGLPDLGDLSSARVVIRGEPGTGKLLTARVIHSLADPPGALVHAPCAAPRALSELAARLAAATGSAEERLVVCLDRPEGLTREQQRELASWIELGPPNLVLDPERTVWIALVVELAGAVPLLEPSLALALGGREIVLPPLRRRPGVAEQFAEGVLRALADASGLPARPLSGEALSAIRNAHWPDNFRQLEATLRRAWALGGTQPIGAAELGLAAEPPSAVPAAPIRPRATPKGPPVRPAEHRAGPPPAPPPTSGRPANRALLQALAHSLRNPLVSLKTFSTLLPEHFAEADFRERFRAQADRDLASLERHLDRLARFAELSPGPEAPVDVAALLEGLLQERRSEIRSRRLLVLSELGADAPWALGSEAALRFAFGALFDLIFAQIRDRQDLYVSCRRPAAGDDSPLRILLRFHGTPLAMQPGAGGSRHASLELVLAEAALEPYGGRISYESLAGDEQLLRVDLRAAASEK